MKKCLYVIFVVLVIFVLCVCFTKKETNIFIGHTTELVTPYVDVNIMLDDDELYNDTIYSSHVHYIKIKKKLSVGFHKVSISLINEGRKDVHYFFFFFENSIVIDFIPKANQQKDGSFFWIDKFYGKWME